MTYLTHKLAFASALSVIALAGAPTLVSAHENTAGFGLHLGVLAHQSDDRHDDDKDKKDKKDRADSEERTTSVAGTVTAVGSTTITLAGNNGVTYALTDVKVKGGALSDVQVDDSVIARGTTSGSALAPASVIDMTFLRARASEARSHVRVGIVTAVNGSTFTIESLGSHPKTTVTTDASTVVKAKHDATSSSAITVGTQVFVVGTTTASSNSSTNETLAASLVKILGKGLGHLKFWLWF